MSTFEKVQLVIKEVISMVINKEKKSCQLGKNCFSEMLKKKYKPLKDLKRDHEAWWTQTKKKKMFPFFDNYWYLTLHYFYA